MLEPRVTEVPVSHGGPPCPPPASVDAELALVDPDAALLTRERLQRHADLFRYAPHVYFALLAQLEARGQSRSIVGNAADVQVEQHSTGTVHYIVEGSGSPRRPARRRVLVESPHYLKGGPA